VSCCGRGSGKGPLHHGGRKCGCGHSDESQVETDLESLEQLQRDLEQEVADVAARIRRLNEGQQPKVDA